MAEDKKYRFVVRTKKEYVKSFKPLKKKSVGFGKIKDIVLAVFKSKTRADKKSKETIKKHKPIVKGVMRKVFMYIGAVLIILGIFIAYLLYIIHSSSYISAGEAGEITPSLNLTVINYGIANIGAHNLLTPYAIVKASGNQIKEVELFLEAADQPMYNEIYILNSRREQGTSYDEFKRELQKQMGEYGVTVNEIYLEELESLPQNANPLIIIPTGYMPSSMLFKKDDSKGLKDICKSATVIYIGYGYDEGIMDEKRGRLFPGVDYDSNAIDNNLNIKISSPLQISALNIKAAKYSIMPTSAEETTVKNIYDGIPVVKFNANDQGYLIAVPNTLDSGWKSGKDAADDIAKIISEKQWLKAFDAYIGLSPSDHIKFDGGNKVYDVLITSGKVGVNTSYVRVYAKGYDKDNQLVASESKYLVINKVQKGTVKSNTYAVSEKLAGKKLDIEAFFDENPSRFKQPIPVWLRIINSSGEVADEMLFGSQYILPIKYTLSSQYDSKLSNGKYIIKLQTASNPPLTLAESVLIIPKVSVIPLNIDWKKQHFEFALESPELGDVRDTLTTNLKDTNVIIDNKIKKKISIGYIGSQPRAFFDVDEKLEEGKKHTFAFDVQKGLVYESVSNIRRMYYEEWWFWLTVVLTIVIAGVGVAFKAREKIKYSLDIPNFEIRKKIKIKVKRDIVLKLFEVVNKNYGWKYMPLSIKEIKSGFRKITYKGRPILIGDFNLHIILDKLKYGGYINEYMGLYSLKKWEKESGYDYRFLSLFRKTRDLLINEAISFTKLGERKDCDMYIKQKYENVKIVFGEGNNLTKRILNAIKGNERTLIVFSNDEEKNDFIRKLAKMGDESAIIKIAMLNNKLVPTTIKMLRQLLK